MSDPPPQPHVGLRVGDTVYRLIHGDRRLDVQTLVEMQGDAPEGVEGLHGAQAEPRIEGVERGNSGGRHGGRAFVAPPIRNGVAQRALQAEKKRRRAAFLPHRNLRHCRIALPDERQNARDLVAVGTQPAAVQQQRVALPP